MYYLCNMEWLNSLFFEHTPLQAVVILSIIIAVGLGLGKIHLFGISLGVTFVFFAGILAVMSAVAVSYLACAGRIRRDTIIEAVREENV